MISCELLNVGFVVAQLDTRTVTAGQGRRQRESVSTPRVTPVAMLQLQTRRYGLVITEIE